MENTPPDSLANKFEKLNGYFRQATGLFSQEINYGTKQIDTLAQRCRVAIMGVFMQEHDKNGPVGNGLPLKNPYSALVPGREVFPWRDCSPEETERISWEVKQIIDKARAIQYGGGEHPNADNDEPCS